MQPMFATILCAVDMSDHAQHAIRHAMSLAERYRSKLIVLHVVEPITTNPILQSGFLMGEDDWQSMQAQVESQLMTTISDRLQTMCAGQQLVIPACDLDQDNLLVRKGVAVEEILAVARSRSADLIVMGTRGHGLFTEAFLGGTARRVVRHSPVPVLVVPTPADPNAIPASGA